MTGKIQEDRALAVAVSAILAFAALAKGAHDLWAASLVYGLALICWAASLVLASKSSSSSISSEFLPALAVLLGAFYLSTLRSVNATDSYLEFMDWVVFAATFSVSLIAFRDARRLSVLILFMAPVLCFELAAAVYQKLGYGPGVLEEEPAGTLLNANFSAAFHLMWLPVYLSKAIKRTQGRWKFTWAWVAVSVAVIGTLILGRSALAAIVALAFLPLLIGPRRIVEVVKKNPRVVAAVVGVVLAAALFVVWFKLSQVYRWAYTGPFAKPTSRFAWWASAFSMFRDAPFTGLGIGTYGSAYLAYKIGSGQNTLYAHSFPIGLLAETGLAGIAAVTFFISQWFRRIWQRLDSLEDRWPFLIGALMFFAFALVNFGPELLSNLLCWAVFLGACAAVTVTRRPIKPLFVWCSAVLMVGLLPLIAAPFFASQQVVAGQQLLENAPGAADPMDNVRQSKEAFESAIALDNRSFEAHRGLAQGLAALATLTQNSELLDQAIGAQQTAIDKNRLNWTLWYELSRLQSARGQSAAAKDSLRRASELHRASKRLKQELEQASAATFRP